MAGTPAGGRKAAITNRTKYGKSFYNDIGRLGGTVGNRDTKGFAHPSQYGKASEAGRKGGETSRRNRENN